MDLAPTSQEAEDTLKRAKLLIDSINAHYGHQVTCQLITISAAKTKMRLMCSQNYLSYFKKIKNLKTRL